MGLFVDKKSMQTERKEIYLAIAERKEELKMLKRDGWYAVTHIPKDRSAYVTFERKVPFKMSRH